MGNFARLFIQKRQRCTMLPVMLLMIITICDRGPYLWKRQWGPVDGRSGNSPSFWLWLKRMPALLSIIWDHLLGHHHHPIHWRTFGERSQLIFSKYGKTQRMRDVTKFPKKELDLKAPLTATSSVRFHPGCFAGKVADGFLRLKNTKNQPAHVLAAQFDVALIVRVTKL